MDIVTNIIIFLLASVVNQVALGNVNVSVPTLSSGAGAADADKPPEKPPLNLTVSVGATGFTVAASGGVLPMIPKLPTGQYDYASLTAKLQEIKIVARQRRRDQGELQRRRHHPLRHRRGDAGCHAPEQTTAKCCSPTWLSRQGSSDADATEEMSRLAGKRAIRAFARKLAEPDVVKDLNITPMMDMMTIILVFLLKTFSSSTSTITFDQNLQVPKSMTQLKPKEAVSVTITKKIVLVEGDAIAPINNGKVDPAVKRDGENGYYITPLVDMLEKHSRKEKKVAELTGQKFEAQLMIVADQTTPYRLLTEVLYSCGQAGYANYRLLVLKARD